MEYRGLFELNKLNILDVSTEVGILFCGRADQPWAALRNGQRIQMFAAIVSIIYVAN